MLSSLRVDAIQRITISLELCLDAAGFLLLPILVLAPHGIAPLATIAGVVAVGLVLRNGMAGFRPFSCRRPCSGHFSSGQRSRPFGRSTTRTAFSLRRIGADGTQHSVNRGASGLLTHKTVTEGRDRADKRQTNRKDLRRYQLRNH